VSDLVGTCPKGEWEEWIAEGDAAGLPESGEEWGWFTATAIMDSSRWLNGRPPISPGERFYVVAHGKLRGYAPVTRVVDGVICRRGGAVAVTITQPIPGFRGLRRRWWRREDEIPFPDWKVPS
jgi:hypothetical protein